MNPFAGFADEARVRIKAQIELCLDRVPEAAAADALEEQLVRRSKITTASGKRDGFLVVATSCDRYRVELLFAAEEVGLYCSCPAFSQADCKHLAGLLLRLQLEVDENEARVSETMRWSKPAQQPGETGDTDTPNALSADEWLAELKQFQERKSGAATPPPGHAADRPPSASVVCYELSFEPSSEPRLTLRLAEPGPDPTSFAVTSSTLFDYQAFQFCSSLKAEDQPLLRALEATAFARETSQSIVRGSDWLSLLPDIVQTGRCILPDGRRLSWGGTAMGRLDWFEEADGFRPVLAPANDKLLRLGPRFAGVDLQAAELVWIDTACSQREVELWLSGPLIAELPLALAQPTLEAFGVGLPDATIRRIREAPERAADPVLVIGLKPLTATHAGESLRLHCLPMVDYGTRAGAARFVMGEAAAELHQDGDGQLFQRQIDTEQRLLGELLGTRLAPLSQCHWLAPGQDPSGVGMVLDPGPSPAFDQDALTEFLLNDAPLLEAKGWRVELEPEVDSPIISPADEHWFQELDLANQGAEAQQPDWFRFDLGVEVDGERIQLAPILYRLIEKNPGRLLAPDAHGRILVPLDDGRLLRVPDRIAQLALSLIFDIFDMEGSGCLCLGCLPALALLSNEHVQLARQLGNRELEALKAFKGVRSVKPPAGLQATLRPYQAEGLAWLQFLRSTGLNGILADDMGLGKTIQTLAHILKEKNGRRARTPCLVVAPTSVIRNWQREAQTFTPRLSVHVSHGPNRHDYFEDIGQFDLVITSYALLTRDIDQLVKTRWHLVVLDEAQAIKNPRAQVSLNACKLKARHRLCLSGTPLENHLGELWSLFRFLMPGYLGDENIFRILFRTPIEKHQDSERMRLLTARIRPVLLRRHKEQVAADLPAKTFVQETIELYQEQQTLYETVRAAMDERVREAIAEKGLARSSIIVIDAMLKLRQICCHPKLLKADSTRKLERSAKLDRLVELVRELLQQGRRVLVFSQFTSMLGLIEEAFAKEGWHWLILTGKTKDRQGLVDRFQDHEVPLFLISLKAGGTGLNLTAADTVIHVDPWWNPAAENQATDRAHRIGQTKPVFVYRLICEGSIEERIQELQQKKTGLVEGILSGDTSKTKLSQTDINLLLQPLGQLAKELKRKAALSE